MSFIQETEPQSIYRPQMEPAQTAGPSRGSGFLITLLAVLLPGILAYSFATINESRVLAMVVAVIAGIVIIARPFWGLVVFVALLYTRPEESIPAIQGMRLPLVVSSVTFFALIFQKMLSREPWEKSPLPMMAMGLAVAGILSTVANGNTGEAAIEFARIVTLVLLVVNLVNTPERYRTFVTVILTFTCYLAAYSIHLFMSGVAMDQHGLDRSVATGIFSDPNDLAGTIVAGLALVLARIPPAKLLHRILYLGMAAVMVWAILLTSSRGGFLSLMLLIGGFCLNFTRRKVLACTIAAIFALGFLSLTSRHMTNFDSGEDSANSRFQFWVNGIETMVQRPILGVGYGMFGDINGGATAHNSFVLCFTELGLAGYLFWMGCLYCAFRFSPARKGADSATGKLDGTKLDAMGARLALASFLATAFFLSRSYVPVLYILVALPIIYDSIGAKMNKGATVPMVSSKDWRNIFFLCCGSIVFIYLFALKLR
jgi:putative inorganic carbon (hco3(-)) transporter